MILITNYIFFIKNAEL